LTSSSSLTESGVQEVVHVLLSLGMAVGGCVVFGGAVGCRGSRRVERLSGSGFVEGLCRGHARVVEKASCVSLYV
jgi:hypothetical protein